MSPNLSFNKCFWDEKINETKGFTILNNKMKESEETCKNYSEFLEQRAKLDFQYSKDLRRLLKHLNANSEFGLLKASFNVLRSETEKICQYHADCHENLKLSSERVKRFLSTYRKRRKDERERIQGCHNKTINDYEKVIKSRDDFHSKHAIWDSQKKIENCDHLSPGNIEKLHKKIDKMKRETEGAEEKYKACRRDLEYSLSTWGKEYSELCSKAEKLEKERIIYLRNEMWVCANFESLKNVEIDKSYEEVRKSLEKCDEEIDIKNFAETKRTGFESKPELPPFEPAPSQKPSRNSYEEFVPEGHLPNYQQSQEEKRAEMIKKENQRRIEQEQREIGWKESSK